MDYSWFIVSNQKEESISIQKINRYPDSVYAVNMDLLPYKKCAKYRKSETTFFEPWHVISNNLTFWQV